MGADGVHQHDTASNLCNAEATFGREGLLQALDRHDRSSKKTHPLSLRLELSTGIYIDHRDEGCVSGLGGARFLDIPQELLWAKRGSVLAPAARPSATSQQSRVEQQQQQQQQQQQEPIPPRQPPRGGFDPLRDYSQPGRVPAFDPASVGRGDIVPGEARRSSFGDHAK
eukprot:1161272-Pelagomonas_calceolata.AAC.2